MKRIGLLLLIIILLLVSCQPVWYVSDWEIPVDIVTVQEGLNHVYSEYNYVEKSGVFLPEEMYYAGYGDCEDKTLLLQHIFEIKLDMDTYYVVGRYSDNQYLHAWIESGGKRYESTNGLIVSDYYYPLYVGIYKYTYVEAMGMAYTYGGFLIDSKYKY